MGRMRKTTGIIIEISALPAALNNFTFSEFLISSALWANVSTSGEPREIVIHAIDREHVARRNRIDPATTGFVGQTLHGAASVITQATIGTMLAISRRAMATLKTRACEGFRSKLRSATPKPVRLTTITSSRPQNGWKLPG